MANYYKKVGDKDRAIELARRLSDLQGIEKDEANKLLQELNEWFIFYLSLWFY